MELRQIVVAVPQAVADAVAGHLAASGASALEVRDASTLQRAPEGATELVCVLPEDQIEPQVAALARYLDELRTDGAGVDPWSWRHEELPDESWRERYKDFFHVRRVGRRFVIQPSWEAHEPAPHDLVIRIDPGAAFGTGNHASTRLCLRALERTARLAPPPGRVLDLGCGSGILAVAVARLWDDCRIDACDVDALALEVAAATAEANGVRARLRLLGGSIERAGKRYDLVVANLQADLLTELRDEIVRRLAPDGRLIASGLLADQGAPIGELYCGALAMEAEYSEEEEGWRALVLRRRP